MELNPSLAPPSAKFPLLQTQGNLKMNLNALATEVPGLSQVDGMVSILQQSFHGHAVVSEYVSIYVYIYTSM